MVKQVPLAESCPPWFGDIKRAYLYEVLRCSRTLPVHRRDPPDSMAPPRRGAVGHQSDRPLTTALRSRRGSSSTPASSRRYQFAPSLSCVGRRVCVIAQLSVTELREAATLVSTSYDRALDRIIRSASEAAEESEQRVGTEGIVGISAPDAAVPGEGSADTSQSVTLANVE